MARTIVLFLMVTLLACCEMDALGHVHVSYLGCYLESPYDSLFYKAYLDYRNRIDWTKSPDVSHVTQACAQEAIKRNYSYFAIKNYGVCSWGPKGLTVTSKGKEVSGCFLTIGGPWAVSVFKILKPKVNGGWSLWSQWGSCSRTCSGGSQTRSRTCTNPPPSGDGASCQGSSFQTLSCNTDECPVDGGWSDWGAWSICSLSCGSGRKTRARTCTNPSPAAGGADCVGNNSVEAQSCNTDSCPVNGAWSAWGAWSECSLTCGGGEQTRMRTCSSPPPSVDGLTCQGSYTQSQPCNTKECEERGIWGGCSQTCGGGTQIRKRPCTNPTPSGSGTFCQGNTEQSKLWNTQSRPINGEWSIWGVWSTCSQTCDHGIRSRVRTCSDGVACQGPGSQSQLCNANSCPVNGGWSHWGAWGSCTQTCGGGIETRSRTCKSPAPANGGLPCPGSSLESQACNSNTCPDCQEGSTSFDQCGQRCTCVQGQFVNCVRIRKEFTSMTFPERERYIRIVLTVSTDPKFKNDYDELINQHRNLFFSEIHGRTHFLPWHRYFMLLYENLLRRVDCNFTVAYWDWSSVSVNPFSTENSKGLWHAANTGFGGNGVGSYSCVQTGPFREANWSIVPLPANSLPEPGPRCLARRFNGNPPDSAAVQEVLKIPASNFTDFELLLRVNLHDVVHCLIDGTMCSIDSAAAPEFFLHHGFIDKIWDEWQRKSDAHRNAFFPGINEVMPGFKLQPREIVNLLSQPGGARVEYQPSKKSSNLLPLLRGLGLNALYGIPRRQFSGVTEKVIKTFHLKPSEVKRAKELEKLLQPLI